MWHVSAREASWGYEYKANLTVGKIEFWEGGQTGWQDPCVAYTDEKMEDLAGEIIVQGRF